ncbi:response regulator [bacterium]|nr:response regulator [bacterium]
MNKINTNSKKKIFIVDDEVEIREIFQNILTEEGYEVETFPNCEGLLTSIISSPPDLLIMDLILPWEKGEDFIQRFNSIDKIKNFPIIVVSGKAISNTDIQQLKSNGVINFYSKPFDIQFILRELSTLLMAE